MVAPRGLNNAVLLERERKARDWPDRFVRIRPLSWGSVLRRGSSEGLWEGRRGGEDREWNTVVVGGAAGGSGIQVDVHRRGSVVCHGVPNGCGVGTGKNKHCPPGFPTATTATTTAAPKPTPMI